MVRKAEELGKADFVGRTDFLFDSNRLLKSFLVVGRDNDLSFWRSFQHVPVVGEVVGSRGLKVANDWSLVAVLLGQPSLFYDIGSPHEFRSELKLPFLCQFDLKQSPFDRPLEIVLNGRNDVEPVLIVPFLELL